MIISICFDIKKKGKDKGTREDQEMERQINLARKTVQAFEQMFPFVTRVKQVLEKKVILLY